MSQAAQQADDLADGVFGNLVGQYAGGAGNGDGRFDDAGDEKMIEAGGGRLNPFQAALADDAVPIDGDFWMAAKYIAIKKFFGRHVPGRHRRFRLAARQPEFGRRGGVRRDSKGRCACGDAEISARKKARTYRNCVALGRFNRSGSTVGVPVAGERRSGQLE